MTYMLPTDGELMPYLSLSGAEWKTLFTRDYETSHLRECCTNVEDLREIIRSIYQLDIDHYLASYFMDCYAITKKLHRNLRYAVNLEKLARWIERYYNTGFSNRHFTSNGFIAL